MILVVLMAMGLSATEDDIRVFIGEHEVNFADQRPVIVDGRTLVPIRDVFEAMGFVVEWDEDTEAVMLSYNDGFFNISIEIGAPYFGVGIFDPNAPVGHGVIVPLDVPAQIIGGRTMLPLRALLEHIGYELEWDEAARAVMISANTLHTMNAGQAEPVNLRALLLTNFDEARHLFGTQVHYDRFPGSYAYLFTSDVMVFAERDENNERIITRVDPPLDTARNLTDFADKQALVGERLDDVFDLFGEVEFYVHRPDRLARNFDSGLNILTKVEGNREMITSFWLFYTFEERWLDYVRLVNDRFHFDGINGQSTFDDVVAILGFEPPVRNRVADISIEGDMHIAGTIYIGSDGRVGSFHLSAFLFD